MAFVVDSADWNFNGRTSMQVQAVVECFLDQVAKAAEQRQPVWIGEGLQTRAVWGEKDLWSLRDPESEVQLDAEVWQELAAHLGRAKYYLDEQDWPEGMDDIVMAIGDDGPSENEDVAWAHHNVRTGNAVACIGLWRLGPFETTSSHGKAQVHWICDERSTVEFWRSAIAIEGDGQAALLRFAHRAYPNLCFYPNVLSGADRFNGGYYANASELMRYLSALSDHGAWVFTAPPPAETEKDAAGNGVGLPTSQLIQRRFELLGLVVAPENPDVYRDGRCRRAREVEFGGRVLYCEWHCKLQPHQNRIHIHAPVRESDDKVMIAIFAVHLPLPGN
ncbi:hypothetical protein [Burkholderia ubonensis]|uniref:hypothetical protein n=1 Tax=Burkholderia ubonensis TaxID=101571 RepID=UPI0005D9BEEE|nr:hypothetical protein [Burkholderia ubonensis]AJX14930.1 hypothetical protein BW23_6164 [Burkholderia ubonensis MSMB22]